MNMAKKILDRLFSTSAAGLYIVLFALAIGAATFIENDFGTSAAQKVIFKSHWFELLLALFGICLIVNIFRFNLIGQKKWAILTFHAAMVVILIGAGVTRYFGREGMMGIREGNASNYYLSSETYLRFQVEQQGKKYTFDEPVLFASLGNNHFEQSYLIGNREIKVTLTDFIPNPEETIMDDANGVPILKVVMGGMGGREEYFIQYLDKVNIHGTLFNFGNPADPQAFNIKYEDEGLSFVAGTPFLEMVMASQTRDTLAPGEYHPLKLRSLYSNGQQNFVFGDFRASARREMQSGKRKISSDSEVALALNISYDNDARALTVRGRQGAEGTPAVAAFDQGRVSVAYGAKRVVLPFSIGLRDFIMERYPGTNSASSYASEVTLIDPRKNLNRDQRVYMNHILDYDGYRFFQSSYDQDELGTYLSVNFDVPGTLISYFGYFLLTLGMILTLFSPKSRFQQLAGNIKRLREAPGPAVWLLVALFAGMASPALAEPDLQTKVNAEHATKFGHLLVQDNRGRFKPMNTFASEMLRKVAHQESMFGLSPEQIVLGMAADPRAWYNVPLIKIGEHEAIRKLLGLSGKMAAYSDFFNERGEYKLKDAARDAFNKPSRERGVFEKEIVKVDERLNICNMIFSGEFMKVFPIPGDPTNTWKAPTDVPHQHGANNGATIVEQFYPMYIPALQASLKNHDHDLIDRMVGELQAYQQKYGGEILPSQTKINAELLLNKLNLFGRLGKLYGLLGLMYLGLLFATVFKPNAKLHHTSKAAFGLLVVGFLAHTFGLGLRWYISGRAPWSNGYESMIYIGWTTVLAGLLFSRKSYGGMSATTVLAATIMMVAGMSWLDPEITPLVPVLKSYWLTIHVSLEAGSYGFLVLGAIIGLLNLILMVVANESNREKVYRIIKEMSYVSEMTLIGGLFMMSIGTYLGGVWANESWGRYWGWDAKETWALVSILVYSFILHMRFIPGLRGLYAYNVATLFGWASIAMTYFGVNYYLSGLHSYAAGDPVPIPDFVTYIVAALILISLAARWKYGLHQNKKPT